jgi:hypothetical protein
LSSCRAVELSSTNSIAASGRVFVKTLGRRWRRALLRLREPREKASDAAGRDAAFALYQQALRDADARLLFAMLRQPPARAIGLSAHAAPPPASGSPRAACQVVQIGGRLGLVLTLGGKLLCVLPLEARQEEAEALSL